MRRHNDRLRTLSVAALGAALSAASVADAAQLVVGTATGVPGEVVEIEVVLDEQGDSVFRTALVIELPARFTTSIPPFNRPDCRFLTPGEPLGGFFAEGQRPCDAGQCTDIVVSVHTGARLPNGPVFACRITVAPDALPGTYVLQTRDVSAFDIDGNSLPATASAGAITVEEGVVLSPGYIAAAAGAETILDVRLSTNVAVAGLAHELTLPAAATLRSNPAGGPRCSTGAGLAPACVRFAFLPAGCTPEVSCTGLRATVDAVCNAQAIPVGTVYTCDVGISVFALMGNYPIVNANATAVDLDGAPVTLGASPGTIAVSPGAFVRIDAGYAGLRAGETGSILVFLDSNLSVDAVQHDLVFEPEARIASDDVGQPRCAVMVEGRAAQFTFLPEGCAPGSTCSAIRVRLPGPGPGLFPRVSPLYRCTVVVAAQAAPGSYALRIENLTANGPDGEQLPGLEVRNGQVMVQEIFPATLVASSVSGRPGQQASLALTLESDVDVAGTENDILFAGPARIAARPNGRPSCVANSDISQGSQAFAFRPFGCDPGSSCVAVRAIVLSTANVDPIPNGTVLYTCDVVIDSDARGGTSPIEILNTGASSPEGESIVSRGRNGVLAVVEDATPTPTLSSTATAPVMPTGTPTDLAIATATLPPDGHSDGGCAVSPQPSGCAPWLLLPLVAWATRTLWAGRGRRRSE